MKKEKLLMTVFGLFVGLFTICIVACDDFDDEGDCPDRSPYWCSSAKVCCAYKYYDGHGTCWETMSGCRSGGYQCESCHLED